MIGVVYLTLAIFIVYFSFVPFQAIGGKLFGAQIEEVGGFIGPKIFQLTAGGVTFRLNALPFGSYVKFTDGFADFSPLIKISITFIGLLSFLFVGIIGLGLTEPFRQTFSGFAQLINGALSPGTVGASYLEALAEIMTQSSFLFGLGIVACKFLAFNLFPLGTLAGGNILIWFLEMCGLKSESLNKNFQLAGFLFLIIFYLTYLVAFVFFVINRIKFN